MINNDSVVTAYDEHLTLVEWLQKVEVLLKNGGLKETTLNDKGNATFSLTLVFNDGSKIESNAMTLTSVNTALTNLSLDLNTATQRIDDLEDEVDNKTIPLFGKYSVLVPEDSAETNILPCTPSDNGKVLSVVNGEAQWASAGGGSGGSGGNDINVLTVNGDTFTGSIKQDKINLIKLNNNTSLVGIGFVSNFGNMLFGFAPDMNSYGGMTGNLRAHILIENDGNAYQSIGFNLKYYSHFITLTSGTSYFCLTYQNTSNTKLNTLDSLTTALTRKRLPCTGHTDTKIAEYISGEGETIVVGVVDTSGNSTSAIIIDSSFIINDLVSPVE